MNNLPPGCSVSDIPGNRPEDAKREAFAEMVTDKLVLFGLNFNKKGSPLYPRGAEDREAFYALLMDWIKALHDEAYATGYHAGIVEAGRELGSQEGVL